ncbi:MAG: PKD domain-containing protein [Bacteroidia bacterium]
MSAQGNKKGIEVWNIYKRSQHFIENKGQISDQFGQLRNDVRFIYNAPGLKVFFKDDGFSYEVYSASIQSEKVRSTESVGENSLSVKNKFKQPGKVNFQSHRVDISFVHPNKEAEIQPAGKSEAYENYYLSHTPESGIQKVYNYSEILYKNIWPYTDIKFYIDNNKLKYDIILYPGADLQCVKMLYNGARKVSVANNQLNINTSLGRLKESMPLVYTREDNQRVNMLYHLNNKLITFKGKYDLSKTLIIDPVLEWGSYFGGDTGDSFSELSTDSKDNITIVGDTYGSQYIATSGAHQTTTGGTYDGIIVKFNPNGKVKWATFYGGTGYDYTTTVITDKNDNIFIAGTTASSSGIATSGTHQTTIKGSTDALIVKFNSSGVRQWGTYYGGFGDDRAGSIKMDSKANLYISGSTTSTGTFIVTVGAHQTSIGGKEDAYLAKFDNSGTRQWSTFYGGSEEDNGYDIEIDANDNIYMSGETASTNNISSSNAHQTSKGKSRDAFLVKFNSSGTRQWGTYYGGDNTDYGNFICKDRKGHIYLVGNTWSKTNIATKNAFDTTYGGINDGYLVKFNGSGKRLWGTYVGSIYNEVTNGATCDSFDNIYISGGGNVDSLITPGSYKTVFTGINDAYIVRFDSLGQHQWGTFYGGSGSEQAVDIYCDRNQYIYIAGFTSSYDKIATGNVYRDSLIGMGDAYVAKFKIQGDILIDSIIGIKETMCVNDSFLMNAVIKKRFPGQDSATNIVFSINGPDSLSFTDSIGRNFRIGANDTLHFGGKHAVLKKEGAYNIKVYLSPGDENRVNDTFNTVINVYKFAQPKFLVISNCADTSLSFVNSSISCSGPMSYSWDFGDGDTSTVKAPIKKYSKYGNYKVKLKVTTKNGIDSVTKEVIFYPSPKASFTYNQHCLDSAVAFNDTSLVFADSLTKYFWDFGDGDTSTIKEPHHKYKLAGNYDVKLVLEVQGGCKDSLIKTVSVYGKPVLGYKYSGVCYGDNTVFEDTSKVINGKITNYIWHFGDGDTSAKQNPVHKYKAAGKYNVKLIAKTNFGCIDSIQWEIEIFEVPKADFKFSLSCDDENVSFTNNTKLVTGQILDYEWHFPDSTVVTDEHPEKAFSGPGIYNVKLIVTSSGGCKDSVNKAITVYDRPTTSFTNSGACANESVNFKNTSTVKYGKLSTSFWDFGDGTTSSDSNPVKTFPIPGNYTVKLITVSEAGCKDSVTKRIDVFLKPKVAFTASNTCESAIVSFTNNSDPNADSIVSNYWDFGDGKTSTAVNTTHKYDSAGSYSVSLIVTNNQGCVKTLTKNILINPNTKAGFSANDDCTDESILFTNTSAIASGRIVKHTWFFGDGDTSTLENPSHKYKAPGNYNVVLIVTSDKGCIDSISDSVTVYPMPTAGFETNNICLDDEATFTSTSLLSTVWFWDFGDSTFSSLQNPVHKYLLPGTYMVTLKAGSKNGCTDSISKQIEVYDLPKAFFSVTDICVSDSFILTDSSLGSTNWFWDFSDGYTATLQHPKHKYEKAGTYTIYLTASNTNGCANIKSKQIVVHDLPEANFAVIDICVSDSLFITDSTKGATNYLWSFGDNTTSNSQKPAHKYQSAGTYKISLLVTNSSGCTDSISRTVTVDSSCVWPGDANADKVVDNKDILAIGIAYSDTGSARKDTSTTWKGNLVKDWSNSFLSGQNYKHADSDGDGVITNTDTLAITSNYTKTHAKKEKKNRGKNTDPVLKISIQNDTLTEGDTLVAYIILGENALPAKDIYGLAFSIDYNKDLFAAPIIDYSNSWLGNNILTYRNTTNGLDLALTRTDLKNTTGSGTIAMIKLVLNKDVKADQNIKLEIVDNILISANEEILPTYLVKDSVFVNKAPNSIKEYKLLQPEVKIYPNPFFKQTIIEYNLVTKSKVSISLIDINGRTIQLKSTNQESGKHQFIFDAEQYRLSSGVYFVKLDLDGLPLYERILKVD